MPTFASIADLLASPFELDFPSQYASLGRIRTSEISFQSDEHETESRIIYSVYPSLIECVLRNLASPYSKYRDLQALYVPTISNYIDIDKDTLARLEGKVIEAAQRLRAKPLSMSLTMNALQFVWAFVPVKQDPSRVPSSSSTSSGTSSEFWDHCEEPTIFFSPILDILLRKCFSWEERCHVLVQGIIVCCIELGHLFPRFIYGNDARRIPESYKLQWSSRLYGCIGEGGEWVEEQITGGTHFSILNSIENTSHSASVQPNQPHGFRISGQTLRSGHNKEVVIEDERVSAFLRYFLKADENDMIVIPLLPNSRWSDYLDHSVPLHSKRYRALYPKAGTILDLAPRTPPPFPQNQSPPLSLSQTLQELLPKSPLPRDDLGSPFSLSTSRLSLSTPTMPARSQNGSDKGITVSFPSSYYMEGIRVAQAARLKREAEAEALAQSASNKQIISDK
ncbi:MAG: hypothetical protein NXY57DRAFT_218074 [Lentinula lateritia]|nr:MAG: hypothetical protein NXY57DRAFT_218074 [Lentinula lateritia]